MKWKGLREINAINLISTNSIKTNPKLLKHHLFEKKMQQPFLCTNGYLASNMCVVSAQISMNVWSWMAAVTPSAPIRKEATSAAAVKGMHWCQMGDRVQVQKRYTKCACYGCSATNVTPDLVANGGNVFGTKESHSCFHWSLTLCHQISMSVKTILTSVMVANVPTFLGSTAAFVTMASWLQWTWKRASVSIRSQWQFFSILYYWDHHTEWNIMTTPFPSFPASSQTCLPPNCMFVFL